MHLFVKMYLESHIYSFCFPLVALYFTPPKADEPWFIEIVYVGNAFV